MQLLIAVLEDEGTKQEHCPAVLQDNVAVLLFYKTAQAQNAAILLRDTAVLQISAAAYFIGIAYFLG